MSETISNGLQAVQQQATIAPVLSFDDRVEEITKEILKEKKQVVLSFIQIGKLLDEAKGCLKKEGQWLHWLDNNVDISVRMAQRYIQLAKAFSDTTSVSHLGMTKALTLLALPEGQRETFLNEPHEINGKQKKVEDMSVREIRKVIQEKINPAEKSAETITESAEVTGEADIASQEQSSDSEKVNKYPGSLKTVIRDQKPFDIRSQPHTQNEPADMGLLTLSIESVSNKVNDIIKILESQTTGMVHDKIVNDLRSLQEKIEKCVSLADKEVKVN